LPPGPHFGRLAVNQKGLGKARLVFQQLDLLRPDARNDGHDMKTLGRVPDCRLKQVGKRQSPKALGEIKPARNLTRYGDRIPAYSGHLVVLTEVFWRPGSRGAA